MSGAPPKGSPPTGYGAAVKAMMDFADNVLGGANRTRQITDAMKQGRFVADPYGHNDAATRRPH